MARLSWATESRRYGTRGWRGELREPGSEEQALLDAAADPADAVEAVGLHQPRLVAEGLHVGSAVLAEEQPRRDDARSGGGTLGGVDDRERFALRGGGG